MRKRNGIFAILLCTILVVGITSCYGHKMQEIQPQSYALKLGDVEVIPGETTLQAFYDVDFTVEAAIGNAAENSPEWKTATLSGDMMLGENTICRDLYLMKDGVKQARVDVSTGKACTLADAVVSAIYVDLTVKPTVYISFSGVALSDLSQEAFVDLFDVPVGKDGSTGATYLGEKFDVDAHWNEEGELTTICSNIT